MATPVLPLLLPLLTQRQQRWQHGRSCLQAQRRYVVATVVDLVLVLVFLLFLLPHPDGVMVSHLFPAADIGGMALSVTAAVVLSAIILQVKTKMAPMMMTVATTNEMHHGAPSTPPSNPCLREGEGEGNEGKGGGHQRGRWW
jgi:hypothetical protein